MRFIRQVRSENKVSKTVPWQLPQPMKLHAACRFIVTVAGNIFFTSGKKFLPLLPRIGSWQARRLGEIGHPLSQVHRHTMHVTDPRHKEVGQALRDVICLCASLALFCHERVRGRQGGWVRLSFGLSCDDDVRGSHYAMHRRTRYPSFRIRSESRTFVLDQSNHSSREQESSTTFKNLTVACQAKGILRCHHLFSLCLHRSG